MATLSANYSFDITKLDFNRIDRGWNGAFDVCSATFLGIRYDQVGAALWKIGGEQRISYFAGSNVTYTGDGLWTPLTITGGSFTGFLEYSYTFNCF